MDLILQTLVLATLSLLVILTVALIGHKERSPIDNRYLVALLSVNVLLLARAALAFAGMPLASSPWISLVVYALFALIPGLLYAWARSAARTPPISFNRSEVYAILPGIVVFAWLSVSFVVRSNGLSGSGSFASAVPAVTLSQRLLFLVVLHAAFVVLYVAARRSVGQIRDSHRRSATIIHNVFGAHWLMSGLSSATALFAVSPAIVTAFEILSIALLFAFGAVVAAKGIRGLLELHDGESPANGSVSSSPDQVEAAPSYASSPLSAADALILVDRLERYVQHEEAFLNPTLTVDDVANAIEVTSRSISQVLSVSLGTNFPEYVNRLRVERAKILLHDPSRADDTILTILHDAGFNSKSAFNRVFKELTGQTPSGYRRMTRSPHEIF